MHQFIWGKNTQPWLFTSVHFRICTFISTEVQNVNKTFAAFTQKDTISEIAFHFLQTNKQTNKCIPAGSIPGPSQRFPRVRSHMVRVVQSLRLLCRQGGQHPPAAQEAPAVYILLAPPGLGAAGNRRGPAEPRQGRLQSAHDEAVRLPACVGHVRGQRGRELHALGGLSGELRVLHGATGRHPQVAVSRKVSARHLFLVTLRLYRCVIALVLCVADPPNDWSTLAEVWNSHTLGESSFSAADKWPWRVKPTCLATFLFFILTIWTTRGHMTTPQLLRSPHLLNTALVLSSDKHEHIK